MNQAPALIVCIALTSSAVCFAAEDEALISVDVTQPKWVISTYLTGMHFVYGHEPDAVYRDNPEILEWMKQAKVGIIRWPGGTSTMSYHWDDLNGYSFPCQVKKLTGKKQPYDSWHPKYDLPKRDPKLFMDLDEFIAICRKVGAEPCVGVNILSGRWHRKEKDSLEEARKLIQYCVDKGYNVKFWYIGNEPYAKGFGVTDYAAAVDRFAAVLKEVDPDITIIGDWKFGRKGKMFEKTLALVKASRQLDLIEVHEKWGNPWGLESGQTVADWMKQTPYLYEGRLTDYANELVAFGKANGKPDLRVGYNEWGFGELRTAGGKADLHRMGLLGADYLIEIFRAPVATACYWNLNMGDKQTRIFTVKPDGSVTMNPIRHPFTMTANAMGEQLLELNTSQPSVYGFASRTDSAVQVFLLNKSASTRHAKLQIKGARLGKVLTAEVYAAPGTVKALPTPAETKDPFILPPMSFTRIQMSIDAQAAE